MSPFSLWFLIVTQLSALGAWAATLPWGLSSLLLAKSRTRGPGPPPPGHRTVSVQTGLRSAFCVSGKHRDLRLLGERGLVGASPPRASPRPRSSMARMNRPAPVEVSYKSMRFLITHNPTDASLSTFIQVSGARGCSARCPGVAGGGAWSCPAERCASWQNSHPGPRAPERGDWGVPGELLGGVCGRLVASVCRLSGEEEGGSHCETWPLKPQGQAGEVPCHGQPRRREACWLSGALG